MSDETPMPTLDEFVEQVGQPHDAALRLARIARGEEEATPEQVMALQGLMMFWTNYELSVISSFVDRIAKPFVMQGPPPEGPPPGNMGPKLN